MPITSADSILKVKAIRTETFLDRLSGIGGLPRGRVTEVFGDSGVGKSTVILQSIANIQKEGGKCLLADVEWSVDSQYAANVGVDTKKLSVVRERFAEDVLDTVEKEVSSGNWDVVVIDSVGGLLPRQEAEKDSGQKTIGGQASLVAAFLRKIVPLLHMHDTALVVVNHSFVDILSGAIKTSGGKKLEYHRSLSIRLKPKSGVALKSGDKKVGLVVVGQVKRNKLAGNEGTEVEARFLFDSGFVGGLDLIQEAIDRGVITKSGNTHYFAGSKLGMIGKVRELAQDEQFTNKLKEALNV